MPNEVVLVAEDDADTRETVRQLLTTAGYQVVAAEDSLLAYGLLSSVRPNLILVDIMMPRIGGVGLIRWIRNNREFSAIPIIAMSAYGEHHLQEAREAGATLTIQKPGDIPDLPSIVARFFNSRNQSNINGHSKPSGNLNERKLK